MQKKVAKTNTSFIRYLGLLFIFILFTTLIVSCSGIKDPQLEEKEDYSAQTGTETQAGDTIPDIQKDPDLDKGEYLSDKPADNDNKKTIEENDDLSTDQKWLVSIFGYPDEFMIVFTEEEDSRKIEYWQYVSMQSYYLFYDGEFIDSDIYIAKDFESDSLSLKPQDLWYGMSPEETASIIGVLEADQIIELENGYKVYSYKDGLVICTFNLDSALIGITRLKKISGSI